MAISIFELKGKGKDSTELANEALKGTLVADMSFPVEIKNDYLKDLFEAITNVRSDCFGYYYENIEGYVEHVIAYELYHQWSNIIESKFENYILDDFTIMRVNGEIGKKINLYKTNDSQYRYPDMLLHGGQKDKKHQELIVEIKRWSTIEYNSSLINNDINKLFEFTTKETSENKNERYSPFKIGVFLITCKRDEINNSKGSIIKSIIKQVSTLLKTEKRSWSQKSKIFCVLSVEGESLLFFKLSNLSQFFSIKRTPDASCVEYRIKRTITERLSKTYAKRVASFERVVRDLRFKENVDMTDGNTKDYQLLVKLKQSRKLKDNNAFETMLRCCEYYGVRTKFEKNIDNCSTE